MQRKIYDLKTASEEFCISRRKLWSLISSKRLRAYRLDGKVFVKPGDLENLITSTLVGADVDKIVNETLAELGAK